MQDQHPAPRRGPSQPEGRQRPQAEINRARAQQARQGGQLPPRKPYKKQGSAAEEGRAQRARKRRRRRREVVIFAVMTVVLLGLLLTALILAGGKKDEPSSFAVFVPSSSESQSQSRSASVVSQVPMDLGPYDEAAIPDLFNYENPIPEAYLAAMTLVDVGGGHQMASRAGEAFNAMYAAAAEDGIALTQVSGYRTHEHQTTNYNNSIQNYLSQGYSQEEAVARTEGYYAIPGTSEHEAGLAMDIGWIEEDFENSDAFAWLSEHAAEYGFILRYRADTFDITRIRYEPWHYRYVGANHAKRMVAEGFYTLEEYVDTLKREQGAG